MMFSGVRTSYVVVSGELALLHSVLTLLISQVGAADKDSSLCIYSVSLNLSWTLYYGSSGIPKLRTFILTVKSIFAWDLYILQQSWCCSLKVRYLYFSRY